MSGATLRLAWLWLGLLVATGGGVCAEPVASSPSYRLEATSWSGSGPGRATGSSGTGVRSSAGQASPSGRASSPSGLRVLSGFWATARGAAEDSDGDGVIDRDDNCTLVPNADQADVNAGQDDDASLAGIQHYGDACDADLDDDGSVGPSDFFGVFRPCLGQPASAPGCAVADLDADGVVGPADFFSTLRPALGSVPGPGTTE